MTDYSLIDNDGVTRFRGTIDPPPGGSVPGTPFATITAADFPTVAEFSTWTTNFADPDANILFTGHQSFVTPDSSFEFVDDGPSTPLAVEVDGDCEEVHLGTSGGGAITSTAAQVIAIMNDPSQWIGFQGAWDIGTTYNANEVVSHGGSFYATLAESTGEEPPAGNWLQVPYFTASLAPGSDGTGIVEPVDEQWLFGGGWGPILDLGALSPGVIWDGFLDLKAAFDATPGMFLPFVATTDDDIGPALNGIFGFAQPYPTLLSETINATPLLSDEFVDSGAAAVGQVLRGKPGRSFNAIAAPNLDSSTPVVIREATRLRLACAFGDGTTPPSVGEADLYLKS